MKKIFNNADTLGVIRLEFQRIIMQEVLFQDW